MLRRAAAALAAPAGAGAVLAWAHSDVAQAAPRATKVGEFSSSGLLFRDTVEVHAFADPKVEGVTLYLSSVRRPITDRLRHEFFTDPSTSSIAAAQSGPIRVREPIVLSAEGEEVFSAKKNLFFKNVHVRRIYDEVGHALVYVAYSSRLSQDMAEPNSRYRTSLAAVPLAGQPVAMGPPDS